MAAAQNKKQDSAKGKKVKKGSPAKRSFFFTPATIILTLLTTLLLVLGVLYFARVQQWFSPPVAGEKMATPKLPTVEYPAIPDMIREVQKPLIHKEGALVAVIVDDLGTDLAMIQDLLDLQLNLTVAVMPNVPHARAVAELAHANGREVLLHMPMEPKDFPAVNPGATALMVNLSATEIQDRLRGYLQTVPWVVGANNHMGSRFTENRKGMQEVLQILKEQGLFFVDSRTTAGSVAITEAKSLELPYAARDVFLDNEIGEEAIRTQIRKLIKIAEEKGSAIGICHPHPETYAALKKEAHGFAAAGVTLVSVSELVHTE